MSDILGSGDRRALASNPGSSTHFEDILACVVSSVPQSPCLRNGHKSLADAD